MAQQSGRKQVRTTIYIPEDEYRELRAVLAMMGLSVSEWFRSKAKELVDKQPSD